MAGIGRARYQLVENFRTDLHDYLSVAYAALEDLTANHRGLLCGSIHVTASRITDGLRAPAESIESLCCLRAICYYIPIVIVVQ